MALQFPPVWNQARRGACNDPGRTEESERQWRHRPSYERTAQIFETMSISENFEEFLTSPLYEEI